MRLRKGTRRGLRTTPQAELPKPQRAVLNPRPGSASFYGLPPHRLPHSCHTPGDRSRSPPALLPPPSGPASRLPSPSPHRPPASQWGRQGRGRQSRPGAAGGRAAPAASADRPHPPGKVSNRPPPAEGRVAAAAVGRPASADGSGARRIYRPLRGPI